MKTPVLLITFNRPLHTRRVLEKIMEQRPTDLYVFQDGAREGNESDCEKVRLVREVVEDLTNGTDTRLHTCYSEKNLGCGPGPATGISWFFGQVEQGIVMEDDCLPHPDFFGYCEELLERYKDDSRLMFIGSTLYHDRWKCEASYGFSRYMVTGAWASWAKAWKGFDLDLVSLDAKAFYKTVKSLTDNRQEAKWWYYAVKEIQKDDSKKSYWDFQMQIHLFKNSAITIHPKRNLISNIGFDAEGTHTLGNDGRGDRATFPILPLVHPEKIEVDKAMDALCFAKTKSRGLIRDIISNIYNDMLWNDGLGHKMLSLYKKIKGSGYNVHRV